MFFSIKAFHPKVDAGFGINETLQEKRAFHPKVDAGFGTNETLKQKLERYFDFIKG